MAVSSLTLEDLNPTNTDIQIPQTEGFSLDELLNVKEKIISKKFLTKEQIFPVDDCYCCDIESYRLNSKIRSFQLADIEKGEVKEVLFYLHGEVEDRKNIEEKFSSLNIPIRILEFDSEKDLISAIVEKFTSEPKPILGHNFGGFDLGILTNRIQRYKIKGIKFLGYSVGSGIGKKRIYFSYQLTSEDSDDTRYYIADSMFISFTLGIPSKLGELSKGSPYPKKDIDFRIFEERVLPSEAVEYALYDVISLPYVLKHIRELYAESNQYLSIEEKASQLIIEHCWMKGAGSVAEAFLNNSLGRINPRVPDFLSKYYGGLTRCWDSDLHLSKNEKIAELDLTSAYVMSIAEQGIFDILNGDFIYYENIGFDKEIYDRILYSSLIQIKAKERREVFVEVERKKNSRLSGFGYVRSFDYDKKIQDTQHDLAQIILNRGEKIVLTKTELEINKILNPKFERGVLFTKILDGIEATKNDKTNNYLNLYKIRSRLKKEGNPAEQGIKKIILSAYGKLAQSSGQWFNIASASAITGLVRTEILSLKKYSERIGCSVFYTDTDSLYLKGIDTQINKILAYADTLNKVPQSMGESNLKIEQDNIILFWGIKRKNYVKISEEEGNLQIKIKGEKGFNNIRWRDVLFRLTAITGEGSPNAVQGYSLKDLNDSIQKREFSLKTPNFEEFERFCKDLYDNHKGEKLSDLIPGLNSKAIITMNQSISFRHKTSYDSGTYYWYLVNAWIQEVKRLDLEEMGVPEFGELLNVKKEIKELRKDIKKEENFINKISRENKWQEFYDLIKSEIREENSYGEWLSDSDIGKNFSHYFRKLSIPKDATSKDYLKLFEKLREYSIEEVFDKISKLAPKKNPIYDEDISGGLNEQIQILHEREGELLDNKEELEEIVKEKAGKYKDEKPYIGCFFQLNSDYSFGEKDSDEYNFSLNYSIYAEEKNIIPIYKVRDYNGALFREIKCDSLFLKTHSAFSYYHLSQDQKQKLTKAIFTFPHGGKASHNAFYNAPLHMRLRIKPDFYNNIDSIEKDIPDCKNVRGRKLPRYDNYSNNCFESLANIKRDKKTKPIYANSNLFMTNIGGSEAGVRINKVGLFVKERNIFNLYKFMNQFGSLMQILIEKMFLDRGVELEYPRFTINYQIDINQANTPEFGRAINEKTWLNPHVKVTRQGHYIEADITKYLALTCYNKKESALKKIDKNDMLKVEEDYFRSEMEENWRSEIKFVLKRNFHQTLTYIYLLGLIEHDSFLTFIEDSKDIYSQKRAYFDFNSHQEGEFEISSKKCKILFPAIGEREWGGVGVVRDSIIDDVKVYNKGVELPPLEGRGLYVEYTPPKVENNGKEEDPPPKKVRWRFYDKERLDLERENEVGEERILRTSNPQELFRR